MGYDEAYLMIGVLSITISSILSYIAFLININIKKYCIASFISLCILTSIISLFLAKVAWVFNIDVRLYFLSVVYCPPIRRRAKFRRKSEDERCQTGLGQRKKNCRSF